MMPIHAQGYRHWSGRWTSHPYRGWVISRQGIGLLTQNKRFLALMILSAIPFLVRTVMLYVSTLAGRIPFLKVDAKFFQDFLNQQIFFLFVIALYAGAGLIANDLRVNALQVYFSKPITRTDYLLGKLGVLVFFLSLPTLVPGLLLFLLAVLFGTDLSLSGGSWTIPFSIAGYSAVMLFTFAFLILFLSTTSKSSRVVGMAFAAIFFFSQILYQIVSEVLRTRAVAWISVSNNLTQVGDWLFHTPPKYASPVWVSVLIVSGSILGCAAWAHRRIRAIEVVR